MSTITFDFRHYYRKGERRESDQIAYQWDLGHVAEIYVPVNATYEIHYCFADFTETDDYGVESIAAAEDGGYKLTAHIPNELFERSGELKVYVIGADDNHVLTTYEGYITIRGRAKPEDYVDDDPENEATRILTEAREARDAAVEAAEQAEAAASQSAAQASIAEVYDETATYAIGDYCLHDGQLYECTAEITTPEAWAAAHWTAATVGTELNDIKGDVTGLKEDLEPSGISITPQMENGKAVTSNGSITNQTNSSVSDYIQVLPNSVVYLNNLYLGGVRAVCLYDENKEFIKSIISGVEDTNAVITIPENGAYIRATARVNAQIKCLLVVTDTLTELADFIITQFSQIKTIVSYDVVPYYYIRYTDGSVVRSTNYSHTKPIYFTTGDSVVVNAPGDASIAIIAKYNIDADTYTPVVQGINPSATIKKYEYIIPSDGYYVFSYRSATASIKIQKKIYVEDAINTLTLGNINSNSALDFFKQESIVPNMTIKAFKVLNYSDGTLPKYNQVLWNNPVSDVYYISAGVQTERTKIFNWDADIANGSPSSAYQAVILPNGDILFVYQTQFDHSTDDTADGAYRRNPILYQSSIGFKPFVIDFGDNTKPTGWLQNIGVLYSYKFNRLYIAEYTRANEASANIWAVDMPITNVANWHILLTKEIEKPYGSVFKHFHSVQEDPYTNIIYFTSGDLNTSSQVWYSTDGNTLSVLDEPDAGKYRMLNMAFTKDFVYWASDQWEPGHFLWKCSRANNGLLDVANGLTKILEFDDEIPSGQQHAWVATYSTIYLPMFNALMFLDRDDHGEHTSIPIRIYDIGSGAIKTAGTIKDISNGTRTFGFRCVAVTIYTQTNEIAVSYDKNTPNNIAILGNTVTNSINNMILRVYKNGNDYSVTIDTVY